LNVTHNTRQGLIVILIFFGPILIYGAFLFDRSARRDIAAGISSVERSMQNSYRDLAAGKSNEVAQGTTIVSSSEIQAAFCNSDGKTRFSTFIRPDEIYLSKEPVKLKSPQLLCATLTNGNSGFGIDGFGEIRNVSKEEIDHWPHVSAAASR
jgi:hypothetical protein